MSVVQSAGQLVAVEPSWSPSIGPGGSVRMFGEYFADYGAIWRTQPHVRTVTSFLARNTAQLGLHLFERVNDNDRRRRRDHPAEWSIRRPNPWTTRSRLLYSLVMDRCIYDAALWVKFRANDRRTQRVALVRVPPAKFKPAGGTWLDPGEFEITGSQGTITVARESCVYFHGYHPTDSRVGTSPMETMRSILAEEMAATEYREAFWRNGARLEHVITRPAGATWMSDTAKERFWARWNAQFAGTPNAAKTALLEEGMDIKQMSANAKDAQFLEGRKFNLEEAARFFHIPLPLVGILDNANYSNMESAHKQLYQDTLGPDLVDIAEEIDLQLLPEFTGAEDFYFEFNIAEKLKGSFEEQATALQTMTGGPVLTRNEGRARLNLSRIDDPEYDRLIVPMNVIVGGQASPTDSAPPPKGLKAVPAS